MKSLSLSNQTSTIQSVLSLQNRPDPDTLLPFFPDETSGYRTNSRVFLRMYFRDYRVKSFGDLLSPESNG
jgi:hypothetical protein